MKLNEELDFTQDTDNVIELSEEEMMLISGGSKA